MMLKSLLVKWPKAIRLVVQVLLALFFLYVYIQPVQHEFRNFQQYIGD